MKKIILVLIVLVVAVNFNIVFATQYISVNTDIVNRLDTSAEVDNFDFYIGNAGSIQAEFEFSVNGGYIVRLLNATTGKTIQTTTFSSAVNTTNGLYVKTGNKIRLNAGNYRVQVSKSDTYSNAEYVLRINYNSEAAGYYEKENNNTALKAMLIDCRREYTGNLAAASDVDYYLFNINKKGAIQARLDFDNAGIYGVAIYSEENGKLKELSNNKIYATTKSTYQVSKLTNKVRVPAGNYYIKVYAPDKNNYSNSDYNITAVYDSEANGSFEIEPNNSAKLATDISFKQSYTANLSSKSDLDYYRVTVKKAGELNVQINVPQNAVYMITVYKDKNAKLSKVSSEKYIFTKNSYTEGKNIEVIEGDYYICVASSTYVNADYIIRAEFSADSNESSYYNYASNNGYYNNNYYPYNNGYNYGYNNNYYNNGYNYGYNNNYYNNGYNYGYNNNYYNNGYNYGYNNNYYNNGYNYGYNNGYATTYNLPQTRVVKLKLDSPYITIDNNNSLIDENGKTTTFTYGRGTTMIPIRKVVEAFGGQINFDTGKSLTRIELEDKVIELISNQRIAYVNGHGKTLTAPAMIINNRTMLPLRFVMENLGCGVDFNSSNNEITITKGV